MMKEQKEIRDDQIRVLGEVEPQGFFERYKWIILIASAVVVAVGALLLVLNHKKQQADTVHEPALFEPVTTVEVVTDVRKKLGIAVDSLAAGFTELRDTLINDIPLRLYIPHNADMSLHIGRMDKSDTSVVYVAQAADVRADNGGIVGAFVLKGVPRAWGLSKKGFCASIDGKVTVGVAENSPLFEQATEREGYFFRQYPLVKDGAVVDNELKGKAIRRAVCDRIGEIFMVETGTPESLHDFAQALADLGVDQAIYLVGSSAYGWAVDATGTVHEFGEDNYYKGRRRIPKNTSYIVWRRK